MLVVLGGLPGVGKTTLVRGLAKRSDAVHLRVDTIEAQLRRTGHFEDLQDYGYRISYDLAADNLGLGRIVIADQVNPIEETRQAWRTVARGTGVSCHEVQIVCSDLGEWRRRVEAREGPPDWAQVQGREWEHWAADITFDTAGESVERSVARLARLLGIGLRDTG